jgi:hypothetical protein
MMFVYVQEAAHFSGNILDYQLIQLPLLRAQLLQL